MKRQIFRVAVLLLALLLTACGVARNGSAAMVPVRLPSPYDYDNGVARQKNKVDNALDDGFVAGLNDFSYRSASTVLGRGAGANANYSPLSVYLALATAATGAGGDTQAELLALLGASDSNQLADQCGRLYRQLYSDGQVSRTYIANSLWVSKSAGFKKDFAKAAAKDFYADTYTVDFGAPQTGTAMGGWIAEHTNSALAPALKTDAGMLLSILNTLYYNAEWQDDFSESSTGPSTFHAPSGDITPQFMNRWVEDGLYDTQSNFIRTELTLKNDGRMVLVLPNEGVSIDDLTATPEALESALWGGEDDGPDYKRVMILDLSLPKFKFDCEYELREPLATLGIPTAFSAAADFSGMVRDKASINSVLHQTHIGINEKGVEAAAFTDITMYGAAASEDIPEPVPLIFDRPFLYGIQQDGIWLFIGVCNNPTS